MTRARLNWFLHGHKPLAVALETASGQRTMLPFFWEADDGSTIRRMADGSFRVEIWTAAHNWTQFVMCQPAGWPLYTCEDGTAHEMAAPNLNTVDFAGRVFSRNLISAEPLQSDGELVAQ